jgi:hypothetical protein
MAAAPYRFPLAETKPALSSSAATYRHPERVIAPYPEVEPYCRVFSRGSLGEIDGRSREGKFLRRIEADLVAQVGGSPTFAPSLLIRRAARSMLQLELLDAKMGLEIGRPMTQERRGA